MVIYLHFLNALHAFPTLPLLVRLFSPTWLTHTHHLRQSPNVAPSMNYFLALVPQAEFNTSYCVLLTIMFPFILALSLGDTKSLMESPLELASH